ncbi:MAG: hypothetical protein QF635_04145, partial [Candidatus Thalassarchaeaceae archaeon]|nr:hypothetical protein [Candidatus Thalassarchaeaceae archaeon]
MSKKPRDRSALRRIQTGLLMVALMLGSGCLGATNEIIDEPEPQALTASVILQGSPITESDLIIANANIEDGTAPYIANWRLNGVLVQTSNSLTYDAGLLSVGTHTIDVELTDSMGVSGSAAIIFTLSAANRAPSVTLELP